MSSDACGSIKNSFINHRQVRVVVLIYLTSNECLNLHCNCQNSIMVEQGVITHWNIKHDWMSDGLVNSEQHVQLNCGTFSRLIG